MRAFLISGTATAAVAGLKASSSRRLKAASRQASTVRKCRRAIDDELSDFPQIVQLVPATKRSWISSTLETTGSSSTTQTGECFCRECSCSDFFDVEVKLQPSKGHPCVASPLHRTYDLPPIHTARSTVAASPDALLGCGRSSAFCGLRRGGIVMNLVLFELIVRPTDPSASASTSRLACIACMECASSTRSSAYASSL
jgi:hypothetical protein